MTYKRRLLFGFVLLLSLIEVIVIVVGITRFYWLQEQHLNRKAHLLASTHAESLRVPIWNIDLETSENILKSVIVDPDIRSVRIQYADSEFKLPEMLIEDDILQAQDGDFVVSWPINPPDSQYKDSAEIGKLQLTVSQHRLQEYLFSRLIEGVIEFLILLAINFLIIHIIMKWVMSPLSRLTTTMNHLARNEHDIRVPDTDRQDEVGDVARSIQVFKEKGIELAELHRSMEEKIAIQTRDLVKAKEKAESAVVAKGQFLATMSHEIRTPLNGVLGMAQLLEDTELNSEQKESVSVINQSGRALMNIINDILDFSKLDAEQLELEAIPFDLEQMGYDILTLSVSSEPTRSSIQLIMDYQPECPRLFIGDPGRLRQIILNLINNAIKFTHQGEVCLRVRCKNIEADSAKLSIEIQDSGIGIDEKHQERLFDSFTQADQDTTRKYGGTGLGLSICKKLVELMGGSIDFESELNHGACFRITLALPIVEANTESKDILFGLRILFVDEQDRNRQVMQQNLKYLGADCKSLSLAAEVLPEILSANQEGLSYDIAVFDHQLSGIGTLTLAREIKQTELFEHLALVIVTPYVISETSEDFLKIGFDACLTKPYTLTSLQQMLLKISTKHIDSSSSSEELVTESSLRSESQSDLEKIQLNGKVLLVEDDAINQKIARTMLEKAGLRVEATANGVEALQCWHNNNFDLILMDCQMPEMDGYVATSHIRELENQKHTPIIALTANATIQDRQKCLNSGMDDVITKPFKRDDLYQCIRHWIRS